MNINRETFFFGYRASFDSLDQSQVDGLNFLLGKLEQDTFSLKQCAYILATIDHETDHTFQPIKEKRGRELTSDQKRYWPSGYYGRGFVQITWKKNYAKFGIADTPEKALEPETAYMIASRGMREGVFTGKKLSDFINGKADYFNARTIINGHDKAQEIADRARVYEAILSNSSETKAEEPKTVEIKEDPPARVEVKSDGMSLTTKIGAAAGPVGTMATALGIKVGGIQITQGTIYALCAVAVIALVCSTVIYITGKNREQRRLEMSMNNLADKNRNNVVAARGQA